MTAIKKPQWPFYAAWIILPALCIPAAFALYFIIIRTITAIIGDYVIVGGVQHITEDYLLSYIFIPAVALLMGLVQFLLLRRVLPSMGWWIPATVAGWIAGLGLIGGLRELVVHYWSMEPYFSGEWAIDVAFFQLGLAIGLCQWLVLRSKVPQAFWWIVANVVGWGLIGLAVGDSLGQFMVLLLALLPSGATAVSLAFLYKQDSQAEPLHA